MYDIKLKDGYKYLYTFNICNRSRDGINVGTILDSKKDRIATGLNNINLPAGCRSANAMVNALAIDISQKLMGLGISNEQLEFFSLKIREEVPDIINKQVVLVLSVEVPGEEMSTLTTSLLEAKSGPYTIEWNKHDNIC